MKRPRPAGFHAEINVTPLVDVVLVLLIVFMIIVPLTLRGHVVEVPGRATAATPAEESRRQHVLTIEEPGCPLFEPPGAARLPAGCTVQLDDRAVAASELGTEVAEIFRGRPREERVLFLAASDSLNYEAVLRLVDVAEHSVEGLRIGVVSW